MRASLAQMLLAAALVVTPGSRAAARGAPGDTATGVAPAGARIAAIVLQGNSVTRAGVIQRRLGLHAGDRYSPAALLRVRENLATLDFIEYAEVTTRRPSPDEVVVVVWIAERRRFGGSLHLDYERRDKFLPGISLWWLNLGGLGDEIRMRTSGGRRWSFQLAWQSPCMLPARLGFGAEVRWERAPFVFEPFRLADRRARAALWRDFGLQVRATGYYEYRSLKVDESRRADVPDGARVDAAVGIEVEHDSRDRPAYPRRGLHLRGAARRAGLGGGERDARYDLYDAGGAVFLPVPGLAILVGHATWRATSRAVPVYERLFLGGPEDVRGIGFGTVRGDEGFLATVELRRLLWQATPGGPLGFGVHAFRDWGKAWEHGLGFDSRPLHRSWGLGADLDLGTLNLRFEWARAEDRTHAFQFGDRFTF